MENQTQSLQAFEAFSIAQGQFKFAVKDANNPFFKSKYADLASIWSAVGEALTANGLMVMQPLRHIEGAYYIETILRYKDGTILESCLCPVISKSVDAQAFGSAMTYARRYSLASILCIVTDDDDAEAATDHNAQKATANTRQPYERPQQAAPAKQVQAPTQQDQKAPVKMTKREAAMEMKADARKKEFTKNIAMCKDSQSYDWNEQLIADDEVLTRDEKAVLIKKSLDVRIMKVTTAEQANNIRERIKKWKGGLGSEFVKELGSTLVSHATDKKSLQYIDSVFYPAMSPSDEGLNATDADFEEEEVAAEEVAE